MMAGNLSAIVARVFDALIANVTVNLVEDDGELHIVSDTWTLVLQGEPISAAMVALDNEDGEPEELLREALGSPEIAAMSALDSELDGALMSVLAASPDDLTRALAELIRD